MKQKLYVYGIGAIKMHYDDNYQRVTSAVVAPGICTAYSEDEAYGRATRNCENKYPLLEGWTSHGVSVMEVTETIKRWIKEFNL